MNSYQVLHKNDIFFAVDINQDTSSEEIKSLCNQGFKIYDQVIEAASEEKAVQIFQAVDSQGYSDRPFNLKNTLLFRTNELGRWAFLAVTIILLIPYVLTYIFLIGSLDYSANTLVVGLLFSALLLLSWYTIGVQVARWKNCGNNGWYYMLALLLIGIVSLFLSSIANLIFFLYLLFAPEKNKLPLTMNNKASNA